MQFNHTTEANSFSASGVIRLSIVSPAFLF